MGYMKLMDARKVNASPVSRYSLAGPFKGHLSFKSSPYCPGSSNKLTSQYIIEDHMVSHYKKVFSAKAAVDSTVPKSLLSSVKYTDQQRRERLKKDVARNERRAHSVQSLSQKSVKTDTRPSSTEVIQSHAPVHRGQNASPCLGSPVTSTPRFKRSVYPSQMEQLWGPPHRYRSASELGYRSPDARRQLSARSCFTSSTLNGYKSFQDPVQKTYSGDLLQKHSHHFTDDKPFSPRTLKTESQSFLSQYRYYTPPRGKPRGPKLTHQDTFHGSTHFMGGSPEEEWDLHQEIRNDREWSDEESHHSDFGLQMKEQKTRWRSSDVHSSNGVSPDGMKSPLMKKVTAEEEELMYLEFIADVTNDILSRGLYSDRVLERVFARQIEMNCHRLDEDKMRHLLEVLRKDLANPSDSIANCTKPEERRGGYLPPGFLSSLGKVSISGTKEDSSVIACTVFHKDSGEVVDSIDLPSPHAPENCAWNKDIPGHKDAAADFNSNCQRPPCERTCLTDYENEENVPDNLEQSKEAEDLEGDLAESLCMSEDAKVMKDERKADLTEDFLSDDEF